MAAKRAEQFDELKTQPFELEIVSPVDPEAPTEPGWPGSDDPTIILRNPWADDEVTCEVVYATCEHCHGTCQIQSFEQYANGAVAKNLTCHVCKGFGQTMTEVAR